ncbi:hypothetical protein ACFSJW_10370 [Flavobacterium artemisiae]|uniref:Uncharacterized protein n=1 Tax=Flavobacterium artemisiae TaxID=2126556 RepID=A0ABW4HEP2_9FLAO
MKPTLAQIEVESPELKSLNFSCQKTATNGSSFYGLEKSGF